MRKRTVVGLALVALLAVGVAWLLARPAPLGGATPQGADPGDAVERRVAPSGGAGTASAKHDGASGAGALPAPAVALGAGPVAPAVVAEAPARGDAPSDAGPLQPQVSSRLDGGLGFDGGVRQCAPVVSDLEGTAKSRGDCSVGTKVPATVTFVDNCVDTPVQVAWVDFACRERAYRVLQPGESFTQSTYAGHVWLLRSARTGALLFEWAASMEREPVVLACDCAAGLGGRRRVDVPLPDGGRASEWRSDADAGADAGPLPSCLPRPWAAARARPDAAAICSQRSTTAPTSFTLRNTCRGADVELRWVDFECREQRYARLEPGKTALQQSYTTHVWRVRQVPGGELVKEFELDSAAPSVVDACDCPSP